MVSNIKELLVDTFDRYNIAFDSDILYMTERYIVLLDEWNNTHNLVRYSSIEELVVRHVIDSAQLYQYIEPEDIVVDLGSGAGFPGIILSMLGVKKIYLLESNSKKSTFLQYASTLSNNQVIVLNERIEKIRDIKADVITARALADLDKLIHLTQNFILDHTRCLFFKGKNHHKETAQALAHWEFNINIFDSVTQEEAKILQLTQISEKAKL